MNILANLATVLRPSDTALLLCELFTQYAARSTQNENMVQYTMLGELICYCSKCKLDLNHRITLMDGTRPKRVMCLTCKATHSFKDPDKPKTTKKNTTKGTAKALTKAKVSAQEKDWRLKLTDTAKTPSKYNMKEAYSMEELVYHPTFGRGIVVTFDHPDKIHVFFDEGLKVLKGLKKTA